VADIVDRVWNLRLALKRIAHAGHDETGPCSDHCSACVAQDALDVDNETFDPEQIAREIVLPSDIEEVRKRVVRELKHAYERGLKAGRP
jgi:hypothetical protein